MCIVHNFFEVSFHTIEFVASRCFINLFEIMKLYSIDVGMRPCEKISRRRFAEASQTFSLHKFDNRWSIKFVYKSLNWLPREFHAFARMHAMVIYSLRSASTIFLPSSNFIAKSNKVMKLKKWLMI